ncbi:hypothetical protein A3J19_02520 [Candidatus Daviesbacteria bacterium RIFCSPLOWO2_02_FULL_41_8]|uniref:tRNA/rRNA methyltransferase SpoU type domain-containing protein n=3 Tax=Candidatus Daviesiibacteriota TaxID=1752718 RepID=A0A1F5NGU4_9BACT|nr:MAG: hypothetical protein A2871_02180 [Candidatus Daviesbacteria bacterium RIFCSPHIGHO2_01_FULL_41_23]OGE32755.1 MAG: hypothetical protein A3D83_03610 [Candidatus Daviesbacteria bacterium RIFCSPHIGHO2_02_FULL_41_10]OGE76722.1 MAG: hypothetical protein A3J19_02520 [Candidatus Daviesbacteria bacterium RIFCSPLOWO2_02_FULL_41_8]
MVKLNAAQLRKGEGLRGKGKVKHNEIYIILDNVLDTYNIGSIFRLADAVAAKKIFLCGGTEIPPNHKIKKASINTTEIVDWEYCESAVEAIKKVRSLWNCHPEESSTKDLSRMRVSNELRPARHRFAQAIAGGDSSLIAQNDRGVVVAIEQSTKSVPYDKFNYTTPICLIVGNETTGVSKEALEISDGVVEIPMFGVNISLNVVVSLGIVLYGVIAKTVIPSDPPVGGGRGNLDKIQIATHSTR